ncbi:50S ribosomal L1 [Gossypium arboreum]|uniref:50S ribosomal L1 n=1 Tax=Gossypium arboreum TaxID=29729 RepID=A0A0B0MIN8_GOSAR|nr:50S ribosomal L1 [Gossypium arboreum]
MEGPLRDTNPSSTLEMPFDIICIVDSPQKNRLTKTRHSRSCWKYASFSRLCDSAAPFCPKGPQYHPPKKKICIVSNAMELNSQYLCAFLVNAKPKAEKG